MCTICSFFIVSEQSKEILEFLDYCVSNILVIIFVSHSGVFEIMSIYMI